MKKTRKIVASALALTLILTCFNAFTVNAATGDNKISRVGKATRTVSVDQYFELEVKEGAALDDNDMKWSLSKSGIVKFTDNDRYDDEIDLKAIKKGTVKVTCKNLVTGGKIVYTIKVKEKSNNIYISRVGSATKTVEIGDDIDLKVKKGSGLKNSQIKWTISNTNILRFDDGDNTGSDVEVEAKKSGTTTVTAKNLKTGGKIVYTIKVKEKSNSIYISRIGSTTKTVELGDDIDLKVKKGSGLKNSQIKWTISDTSILRFEDGDNIGSEIEVEAKKLGTTTVTAKNLKTGGKIVYKVTVVPDYDD